jgi:hypothetical protein
MFRVSVNFTKLVKMSFFKHRKDAETYILGFFFFHHRRLPEVEVVKGTGMSF